MRTLRVSLHILTVDMNDNDQIEMLEKVNRLIAAIKQELDPEETEVQAFRGVDVEPSSGDYDNTNSYMNDEEFLSNIGGDTCNCPTCKARRAKNNQSRMN